MRWFRNEEVRLFWGRLPHAPLDWSESSRGASGGVEEKLSTDSGLQDLDAGWCWMLSSCGGKESLWLQMCSAKEKRKRWLHQVLECSQQLTHSLSHTHTLRETTFTNGSYSAELWFGLHASILSAFWFPGVFRSQELSLLKLVLTVSQHTHELNMCRWWRTEQCKLMWSSDQALTPGSLYNTENS